MLPSPVSDNLPTNIDSDNPPSDPLIDSHPTILPTISIDNFDVGTEPPRSSDFPEVDTEPSFLNVPKIVEIVYEISLQPNIPCFVFKTF